MPSKHSHKGRTWGTRFDPLPSSPPPSPRAREAVVSRSASEQTFGPMSLSNKKDDKMPHDASVFVGSLPGNIDKHELVRMLTEHLSEHAEVKSIKVVRDSKGGVCAFVQCEDAASATRLIQAIHSSDQKPFLGRFLRYEPARAFRTLLVSYRAPVHFIPSGTLGAEPAADADGHLEGNIIEMDLPTSMTLYRPWKAKFTYIFYNGGPSDQNQSATPSHESNNGSTLSLSPLVYDAETIRKLSAYFGSLEYFGPYNHVGVSPSVQGQPSKAENEIGKDVVSDISSYPAPHNAPRSIGMDQGCWEVKWDHRDDCVSALMTLRRVPHLTVTWAHQPTSLGIDYHPPAVPLPSQRAHHPNSAPYPYHIHEDQHLHEGDQVHPQGNAASQLCATPVSTTLSGHSSDLPVVSDEKMSASLKSPQQAPNSDLGGKVWTTAPANIHDSPLIRGPRSPMALQNPTFFDEMDGNDGRLINTIKVGWTDIDFPPLGDSKRDLRPKGGVWVENMLKEVSELDGPPSSSPVFQAVQMPPASLVKEDIAAPAECQVGDQELDIPPTPELGMSPITPKTPGFPDTPTGYVNNFQALSLKSNDEKESSIHGALNETEREIDPTTIFVGGLEMFGPTAWDEEKVRGYFGRFGAVENVKIIRPLNGRSAFAFVKFNNTDAPARAVLEENNRLYDGRYIRVQLRDCNPPHRGNWKHGRGRVKYQQSGIQRQHTERENHGIDIVAKRGLHDRGTTEANANVGDSTNVAVTEFPTLNNHPFKFSSGLDHAASEGPTKFRLQQDRGSEVPITRSHRSSPDPVARGMSSQFGDFRDWYEDPILVGPTPPPSSFGSSASATAPTAPPFMPYPMPNQGFYPPQPWMQAMPQHFPYALPLMPGYPAYHPPPHHAFPSPAASDASGPVVGMTNAWGPMGGMFTPYMPYPGYPMKVPGVDPPQGPQPNGPPPLLPTGFIHGDQGTLIPVYHPEALDQYMSAARSGGQSLSQAQPPSYPFSGGPQNQTAVLPSQQQGLHANQAPPVQPGTNLNWALGLPPPSHGFSAPQVQQHDTGPVPFTRHRFPARGGHPENQVGQPNNNPQPSSKRPQRRDQQNAYGGNRGGHAARVFTGGRHSRGGNNVDQTARPSSAQAQTQFVPPLAAGDWNQWHG